MSDIAKLQAQIKIAQMQGQEPSSSYYGYPVRPPYAGEVEHFKNNPNVAGMMAQQGNEITFNPNPMPGVNLDAVGKNEAARLWMRENNFAPQFQVNPQQSAQFNGTPYQNNPDAMRQTLLARILSGDQSAGQATDHQKQIADWIKAMLESRQK